MVLEMAIRRNMMSLLMRKFRPRAGPSLLRDWPSDRARISRSRGDILPNILLRLDRVRASKTDVHDLLEHVKPEWSALGDGETRQRETEEL